MKFLNHTKWRTDDLRALVRACAKYLRAPMGSAFTVEVKTSRSGFSSWDSRTVPHSGLDQILTLSVPSPNSRHMDLVSKIGALETAASGKAVIAPRTQLVDIADRLMGMLLAGVKGKHKKVLAGESEVWLRPDLQLRSQVQESVGRLTGSELQEQRLLEAQVKLAQWLSKLKRVQTFVKKYEREVRQRQRRLNAALQKEGKKFVWPGARRSG